MEGGPRERYMVRLANNTYRSIAGEGMGFAELTEKIAADAETRTFLLVCSDGDGLISNVRADDIIEIIDAAPIRAPAAPESQGD